MGDGGDGSQPTPQTHRTTENVRDVVVVLKGVLDREGAAHPPTIQGRLARAGLCERASYVHAGSEVAVDIVDIIYRNDSSAGIKLESKLPKKLHEEATQRLGVLSREVLERVARTLLFFNCEMRSG